MYYSSKFKFGDNMKNKDNSTGPDTYPVKKTGRPVKRKKKSKSSFDWGSLIPSNLTLTIRLPDEDKKTLVKKADEIADKIDHRWKVTQYLIIIGMTLNACAYFLSN